MSRIGLSAALIAAGMLHGLARAETPEEREARAARDKEPPPERLPRYIGVDYGHEPGRVVTLQDRTRIDAAEAKRARKAEKLRRILSASADAEAVSSRGET